jgi:C4-dicarboxylate-specific signal transduction histidine kinase
MEPELEQRRVRVVLELREDLPPILGDSIQIEQVIMNLIRNGLEAMEQTPEESRVLTVGTGRCDDKAIEVLVRDRGPGIRAEEMKKLFQPFFTTKPEGMGMGLAISRSIVQAHGGQLCASANQAGGCTFRFSLPIGKKD